MKGFVCFIIIIVSMCGFTACGNAAPEQGWEKSDSTEREAEKKTKAAEAGEEDIPEVSGNHGTEEDAGLEESDALISPEGMTLETRFRKPEGYTRITAEEDSLAAFLRSYPLKEDQSPVLLYDGRRKSNQNAHAAVLKLPLEEEDLQQCADSVLRIYAEYFWETGQYHRIAFHFVNGFSAEYEKWREGYRIQVSGNEADWVKTASCDDSYEAFTAYLRMVFAYAGTLSMEAEAQPVNMQKLQPGDVFLSGGSPGHVVMILDVCENAEGKKAFLLGQGYMPAQEFHVLKNPAHEDDPWYYEEEVTYPFKTPEYTFSEGSLKHLNY